MDEPRTDFARGCREVSRPLGVNGCSKLRFGLSSIYRRVRGGIDDYLRRLLSYIREHGIRVTYVELTM
jgi:hypothetical protein